MRYTVVWDAQALADLARAWVSGSDRRAITAAADQIDQELATDPDRKGVPFFGDRILVVEPVAVVFAIRSDDFVVEVIQVWCR